MIFRNMYGLLRPWMVRSAGAAHLVEPVAARFPEVPTAFDAAAGAGAHVAGWVNAGVVQDEYADLRSADMADSST